MTTFKTLHSDEIVYWLHRLQGPVKTLLSLVERKQRGTSESRTGGASGHIFIHPPHPTAFFRPTPYLLPKSSADHHLHTIPSNTILSTAHPEVQSVPPQRSQSTPMCHGISIQTVFDALVNLYAEIVVPYIRVRID